MGIVSAGTPPFVRTKILVVLILDVVEYDNTSWSTGLFGAGWVAQDKTKTSSLHVA